MDKKNLIPGKTYLHKYEATVHGKYGSKEAEADVHSDRTGPARCRY